MKKTKFSLQPRLTLFLIGSSWLCFFIIGIFGSCITEKKRLKICNTCATTTHVRDSIVERFRHDTIREAAIPGPIHYLENPCKELCDSLGQLKKIDISSSKNGITTRIKTIGNSLSISANKADTVFIIQVKEKEVYRDRKDVERKDIKCDRPHVTGFLYVCLYWAIFSWIILLLLAGYYYFKRKLPDIKNFLKEL